MRRHLARSDRDGHQRWPWDEEPRSRHLRPVAPLGAAGVAILVAGYAWLGAAFSGVVGAVGGVLLGLAVSGLLRLVLGPVTGGARGRRTRAPGRTHPHRTRVAGGGATKPADG